MSDKIEALEPEPDEEDDNYQPLNLPPAPTDANARRALREQQEQAETQREIVLGRLAVAYSALDSAEEAGDDAAATQAQETIDRLIAERDRL